MHVPEERTAYYTDSTHACMPSDCFGVISWGREYDVALRMCRCMCGAPNCRGTMDSQPERFKDFGKRLDVFWDGDSVFYRGTVTAYSTTTRKHTILYDDNDVERVNLEVLPASVFACVLLAALHWHTVRYALICHTVRSVPYLLQWI